LSTKPPAAQNDRFPHSIEGEKGVLGCIILSPDCLTEAEQTLTEDSFFDIRHQTVWRAILETRGSIGLPAVFQWLRDHGKLDDAGGLAYLASLPDAVPSAAGLDYYVDIVAEKQRLRELAQGAAAIASEAAKPDADLVVIEENLRTAIDKFTAGDRHQVKARRAGDIKEPSWDDGTELLQRRYLCRGGGLLLVGQSGQGKSALAIQMATCWALGRACFDIRPAKPLRSLFIQAENDDGDLWEMLDGVRRGLALSEDDSRAVDDAILIHTENALAGPGFIRVVARLAELHKPDLIFIDPALAYVDGETKDSKAVGDFLRRGLNPILTDNNCGGIVLHHTTKAKNEGTAATADFLYAGLGSVEYTNWARAVLVLETKGDGLFSLHAPKRGRRLRWPPELHRWIRHSRQPDMIFWEEAEAPIEQPGGGRSKPTKTLNDLLALVPTEGRILLSMLLIKASDVGIGQNKARGFLEQLMSDKTLFVWQTKRSGTRPEKSVGRKPQPEQPDLK
jgi:hypothetical protein